MLTCTFWAPRTARGEWQAHTIRQGDGSVRGTFYIAPNGNDRNQGTFAEPFQTLQRAREAVRCSSLSCSGEEASRTDPTAENTPSRPYSSIE